MNNDTQLPKSVNQIFHGDLSPTISTESGDVNITYNNNGVTQKQFDQFVNELDVSRAAAVRFLKTVDEKDVALEEREAQFEAQLRKYKELEQRLAGRNDDASKQVRELLNAGKLDEAEVLLKDSLAARLNPSLSSYISNSNNNNGLKIFTLRYGTTFVLFWCDNGLHRLAGIPCEFQCT
jgi:hypothetical protein